MISERLQAILKILSDYHMYVLQENSLASQNPEETIHNIKNILAKNGDMLEEYLRWRTNPLTKDAELLVCVDNLSKHVEPWNIQISTLAPDWCRLMFKEYPFSISPEHISRLYKNSGVTDG